MWYASYSQFLSGNTVALKTRERCSLISKRYCNCVSKGAGAREPLKDKPCFHLYPSLVRKNVDSEANFTARSRSSFPLFPAYFHEMRSVFVSLTQERLGTKEKHNMAAESLLKCYFYAKQSMKRLPLVFLAFPNVFSVVYMYFDARIMPAAGCKTHKMGTTLTDFRK